MEQSHSRRENRLSHFSALEHDNHDGCQAGALILVAARSDSDVVAFLFNLGGTLIDSMYQHVLARRESDTGSQR